MKSTVIIQDQYTTFEIVTDYSASAIRQCFEDDGYCVLEENNKEYMITPKSVVLIKTDFNKE